MLKQRIASALVGIPIIIFVLYMGNPLWSIMFTLLGLIAINEYFSMMVKKQLKPNYILGYLTMLAILLSGTVYMSIILGIIILLWILYTVYYYPKYSYNDFLFSVSGTLYIGILFSFALKVSASPNAFYIMMLAFILTWSSDIGGYFVGRKWGSHKMQADLSPKKTWEGALGGLALTVFSAVLYVQFVDMGDYPIALIIGLGLLIGIIAPLGDLFISLMKRYFAVKDTGNIIPGHGGVLDRFDSFLLVIPVIYFFFMGL